MFNDSISSNGFFLPLFAAAAALLAGCSASSDDNEQVAQSVAAVEESSDLTDEQRQTVLKLLDDACADSWCEGDYDWHFPKIVCHFGDQSCTLTLRITDPRPNPPATYWRSCKTSDVKAYTDLVRTSPNGYSSLADEFYDQVSDCVDRIEKELRQ